MFKRFKTSLRTKLMWTSALALSTALSMALLLTVGLAVDRQYQNLHKRLTIQAKILANNSVPALLFEDVDAVRDILGALHADNEIVMASMVWYESAFQAHYQRPPKQRSGLLTAWVSAWLPHLSFMPRTLEVHYDVLHKQRSLALLQLQADLTELYVSVLRTILIGLGVLMFSLLVTMGLSQRWLGRVIRPILQLADLAEYIAHNKDYHLRVPVASEDEIGQLAHRFNAMLAEIQTRDDNLERTVAERTDELLHLNRQLQHQAFHDPLTGLPNRLLFDEHLQSILSSGKRYRRLFAVMYFDLDRFKAINDTLGHDIGDKLLIAVSKRLKSLIREDDTLARIGGDEFNLLLNNLDSPDDAEKIAAKILNAFNEPFDCGEQQIRTSTSIGISLYPRDGSMARDLKHHADVAMYYAKRFGRNDYHFFNREMLNDHEVRENHNQLLRKDLRFAVENGEMAVYYQPQVDALGQVIGLEALLRWTHQDNFIAPDVFLPIAEECGLIQPLEEWMFAQLCQDYQRWRQDEQFEAPERIAINVSGHRLGNSRFVHFLVDQLAMNGLSSDRLDLEIIERDLIKHLEHTERVLWQLHEQAIRITVDHFGCGYTSLSYLYDLPIDTLKIDASLLRQMEKSGDGSILKAIISLAHCLHKCPAAIGIERQGQFEYLRQLGCERFQGHWFAKPVPADQVVALTALLRRTMAANMAPPSALPPRRVN